MRYIDPIGEFPIETIWDIGNVLYDVGAAVYNHIKGDHKTARSHWGNATFDAGAMLIPYVPAGTSKVVKAGASGAKALDRAADAGKTYQTYTKAPKNPADGVYSGGTSGKGTPEQNVRNRDKKHHMNETHGPAVLENHHLILMQLGVGNNKI